MENRPNILVIDDDRHLAEALAFRLRSVGYGVETAYDGIDGLEAVVRREPDAMVLDLAMPRMNGLELLAHLCEFGLPGRIPIIVITAKVGQDIRHKVDQLGARFVINKPFDSRQLVAAIQSSVPMVTDLAS